MKQIEITEGMNGYPRNCYFGYTDFSSIAEAEEFARENDGHIVTLHRRNGWRLWENQGWGTFDFAAFVREKMDGYLYAAGQQEQFRVDHIDWLKGELDEEDYETTVKALEPIADEIAKLPRGAKLVYFPQSNSTEVFNNPDVEFYYDTHTYAVGVVLD